MVQFRVTMVSASVTVLVRSGGSRIHRFGPTNDERDREQTRQDRTATLGVVLGRTLAVRRFARTSRPARAGQTRMDCGRSWV